VYCTWRNATRNGRQSIASRWSKRRQLAPVTSHFHRSGTQLATHLDSATVELDEMGSLISYEEYGPTVLNVSSRAVLQAKLAQKRFRYASKERDEESGLIYYGARYYAPWLAGGRVAIPVTVHKASDYTCSFVTIRSFGSTLTARGISRCPIRRPRHRLLLPNSRLRRRRARSRGTSRQWWDPAPMPTDAIEWKF